jgi:predicted phage terminase large subunit-like protein
VWGAISPYHSFLCISHTDDLAVELATKTKLLIESDWYQELFPYIQLRADSQAKSNFKNTFGGSRISFSQGAGVTGFAGNYLIIDDYHKIRDTSQIHIDNAIRIYRETLYNRLNNPLVDVRIIIGQRVHESDLSGYILANNQRGRYKHICLPIELTPDVEPPEMAAHYVEGVLWHDKYPVESFPDLAESDYVFATQYLQRPAPIAGGIIKSNWFEIVDSIPTDIPYHIFVDSAYTSNKRNDPTALLVAGVKDNIVYVKQVLEVWLEFPDLVKRLLDLVAAQGDTHKAQTKVYIEPKASGLSIVQHLRKETNLNVIELQTPKDSKIARVNAVTPKLESRRVKLLRDPMWNDSFLYQLSVFPNGKHDDMCDVLVYATDTLLNRANKIRVVW